jgi:hypothetical protein
MRGALARPSGRAVRGGLVLLALLAVAIGLLATRCQSGSPAGPPTGANQLLSDADVARWPEGSPERALFSWWRDTQYDNLTGYLRFFTPEIQQRLTRRGVAGRDLSILSVQLRQARPTIVSVDASATAAVLYTTITFHQPVGTSKYRSYTLPQAFALTAEGGSWRLGDYLFVDQMITPTLQAQGQSR